MNCSQIKLQGSDGKTYGLEDFKGKRLVLYFYKKDGASGCTAEALEFTRDKASFDGMNTLVVGVSRDGVESHQSFVKERDLKLLLLADVKGELSECFDVLAEELQNGKLVTVPIRSTFVFNEDGHLIKEWRGVKSDGHADQVLAYIEEIAR